MAHPPLRWVIHRPVIVSLRYFQRGESVSLTSVVAPSPAPETVPALVGERLSVSALHQLGGTLGGCSFVKVVVDREQAKIHFLNNARYSFHAIYIGEEILGVGEERVRA